MNHSGEPAKALSTSNNNISCGKKERAGRIRKISFGLITDINPGNYYYKGISITDCLLGSLSGKGREKSARRLMSRVVL